MASPHAGTYSPFEPMSEDALLSLGSMEGLAEIPVAKRKTDSILPGYAAAGLVWVIAYLVHYLPFPPFLVDGRRPISASIIAILAAVVLRNLFPVPKHLMAGCKHAVRNLIPAAIVFTGAGLDLARVASVGWHALAIVLAGMAVAALAAFQLGRMLNLSRTTSLLLGAGTAVCGTSAIVAAAPLVDAQDEDLTLSVGTVSLLGLVLMFALPLAGGLLSMSQQQFGVWAGASIHAVPQVVAAGFTFGPDAGTLATLVKLARVALLAPFLLVLTMLSGRAEGAGINARKLIPGFIWGFLALAILQTLHLVPAFAWEGGAKLPVSEIGNWLLTLAMAAIGLEVNLRLLARVGGRALLAGLGATLVLCGATYGMIRLLL
jgi:uncharacterized integral membrane protein (TIGR00698 family)